MRTIRERVASRPVAGVLPADDASPNLLQLGTRLIFDATVSRLNRLFLISILGLVMPFALAGSTEEAMAPGEDESEQALMEERVRVVGDKEAARKSSGSEYFIDEEELSRHEYTDIQRALRRVPGVNLQDEEGYGLRPNIGFRGTGVERSSKVTLMEDGVLIAPAPYAAPSAYYFPTAGRMESMEVSKGPASIRQGPHTTGGVLNMISRQIPNGFMGQGELAFGDDGHARGKLALGDSFERVGWMVETFQEQVDGFKRLDGGGDTGFDLQDYAARLRLNSREGARMYQSLELKLGTTQQEGNETYLGLAQADFDNDPFRRYAASGADHISTDHDQALVRYFIVPTSKIDVTTTVYRNDFFRNWAKLQSVGGSGIVGILAEPDSPAHAPLMSIIRGEVDSAPGELELRNNRRDYYSQGIQSTLGLRLGNEGGVRNDIEFGVRFHEDEEDRFQEQDEYQMLGGSMVLTSLGDPGSQANRVTSAEALALFVRDKIMVGKWSVEPGLRFESADFTRLDYSTTDPLRTGAGSTVRKNDVDELIPGLGVTYEASPQVGIFGGVHKGFAPPGPGQSGFTEAEESYNYELGVRLSHGGHFQAVGFFSDYKNLLGRDTLSGGGGGTGLQFNGGEVEILGLELSFDRILLGGNESSYLVPLQIAYTYTEGEFQSNFETSHADWAPEVFAGDELPYLPEHQLFAEIGWRNAHWSAFVAASYVDEMRTSAGQGTIPDAERIEDHLVFDLSAEYRFRQHYRTFVRVRNMTDEIYVAASRPAGLRPGLPRTFLAGFGFDF